MTMATTVPCRHVLLTGPPGVGKTTLVRNVCESLSTSYPMKGFYTEEVRAGGRRIGFDVVTLDNIRGKLARVGESASDMMGRRDYRVGQYSVDLHSFEQTALPPLDDKSFSSKTVVVVDEIGKMELFSSSFVQSVRRIIEKPQCVVLATIPVAKGRPIPLVEEIRNRRDTTVFTISKGNRDTILKDILEAVKFAFDKT